jgi:hypothetical protein
MFRLFCRGRVGHSDPLEAQAAQRRGVGAAAELGDHGTLDKPASGGHVSGMRHVATTLGQCTASTSAWKIGAAALATSRTRDDEPDPLIAATIRFAHLLPPWLGPPRGRSRQLARASPPSP